MTSKTHWIAQVLAMLLQALNMGSSIVPAKYQPYVAFGIAVVQAGMGLYSHYYNPDGTPASVAYVAKLLLLFLLLSVPAMAQTPPPAPTTEPIQITASAVSLPGFKGQTFAGTLAGLQVNITPAVGFESINLVSSSATTNGFFGGYTDGHLSNVLSKALNNASPWLNGYNFRLRLHADVGAMRISDPAGNVTQHFGALAGGTFDYAIKGSPTFSIVARVDDLFTKGLPNHHNLVVAVGPFIHF